MTDETDVALTGTVEASRGGNISASEITNEGLPVNVARAKAALPPSQQEAGNLLLRTLEPGGSGVMRVVTGIDFNGITIIKLPEIKSHESG